MRVLNSVPKKAWVSIFHKFLDNFIEEEVVTDVAPDELVDVGDLVEVVDDGDPDDVVGNGSMP